MSSSAEPPPDLSRFLVDRAPRTLVAVPTQEQLARFEVAPRRPVSDPEVHRRSMRTIRTAAWLTAAGALVSTAGTAAALLALGWAFSPAAAAAALLIAFLGWSTCVLGSVVAARLAVSGRCRPAGWGIACAGLLVPPLLAASTAYEVVQLLLARWPVVALHGLGALVFHG